MKNKSKLPDPPLFMQDIERVGVVTQQELKDLEDAKLMFHVARADYEKKRAAATLKLLQLAEVQKGDWDAEIDPEGNIVIFENCSVCLHRHRTQI